MTQGRLPLLSKAGGRGWLPDAVLCCPVSSRRLHHIWGSQQSRGEEMSSNSGEPRTAGSELSLPWPGALDCLPRHSEPALQGILPSMSLQTIASQGAMSLLPAPAPEGWRSPGPRGACKELGLRPPGGSGASACEPCTFIVSATAPGNHSKPPLPAVSRLEQTKKANLFVSSLTLEPGTELPPHPRLTC